MPGLKKMKLEIFSNIFHLEEMFLFLLKKKYEYVYTNILIDLAVLSAENGLSSNTRS